MNAELSDLWSLEAEEAVLGSLMIDNASIVKIIPILKQGDFYRDKHQFIFEAIKTLHDKGDPCDPVTLTDELERVREKNGETRLQLSGGPAAITELFQRVPTALHVEYYANIVAEFGALRRLVWVGEATAAAAHKRESVAAIRQKIEKWLGQAAPLVRNTIDHINPAVADALYQLEQIRNGKNDYFLPSSLHDIQRTFGGYAKGECTVFANYTSNGKTAWGLQEGRHMARLGYGVVNINTEMYAHVLSQRELSAVAQVNLWQVRRGWRQSDIDEGLPYACRDWDELDRRLRKAQAEIADCPIHVMAKVLDPKTGRVTSPDMTPNGIRAAVRAYAEKHPVDFLVFDYLTNFDIPFGDGGGGRSLMVENAFKVFRELANEVGAAALVLAQYNREADKAQVPQMNFLMQSTGIEKGADNVVLGYSPDEENDHVQTYVGAKGRNAGTGIVENIHFDKPVQTFNDPYIRRLAPDSFSEW